jgi:predicted MFS family arabinose efflux permease
MVRDSTAAKTSSRSAAVLGYPFWLLALTLTMFAFSTDDYMLVGVLPALAVDLRVSEAVAGQLVAVFSITFACAAPLSAMVTGNWRRKRLITVAVLVFVCANLAAAAAPNYETLTVLRVVAATAAATVLPTAFSLAGRYAPEERRTRYLATVNAGLTGALVLGVPIGTWIGALLGWRMSFIFVAVLGLVALILLRVTLPDLAEAEPVRLSDRLAPLTRPTIIAGLAGIAVIVLANMALMTYLAPFAKGLAGVDAAGLGGLFVLSGVAGIVGGQLGGLVAERRGPDAALRLGTAVFIGAMAALALAWQFRPIPAVSVVPLVLVRNLAAWSIPPAAQAKVFAHAGPGVDQVMALCSSAAYVGVTAGAALGGVLLATRGAGALPPSGAVCAVLALLLFWAADRLGTVVGTRVP